MKNGQGCPNGCGATMARISKTVTINYSDPRHKYARNLQSEVHHAYYECIKCGRTYVSAVFKRFKPKNKVGP
jgi:hypothetical protein